MKEKGVKRDEAQDQISKMMAKINVSSQYSPCTPSLSLTHHPGLTQMGTMWQTPKFDIICR